jgi:hypothetical protein
LVPGPERHFNELAVTGYAKAGAKEAASTARMAIFMVAGEGVGLKRQAWKFDFLRGVLAQVRRWNWIDGESDLSC